MFCFAGERLERIDPIRTGGLAFTGDRVMRLLCFDTCVDDAGEILIYDRNNVERYFRINGLADAHDMAWNGESILCVATATNRILWLSGVGEIKRVWQATAEPDAWHVNEVIAANGRTYISAFGIFNRFREWNEQQHANTGIIYDLDRQEIVVGGLDAPQIRAYWKKGGWYAIPEQQSS